MKYFLSFITIIFFSCNVKTNNILVKNTGSTQGTFYHIQYMSSNGKDYQSEIDSLLVEVDNSLSSWKNNSIISRVNQGFKVKVDKMFNDVFYAAKKVYEESEGEFDCSIAPLTNYWGFGIEDDILSIDSSEVLDRLKLVDYSKIKIIDDSLQLPKGMQLDYNSIAQGYSVDLISNFLESNGVTNYLVEIGGEIRANGFNADNKVWLVAIEKPIEFSEEDKEYQIIFSLDNSSLATSGNYRKYKEIDGMKYSHTISAKTGYFAKNRMLSATVVHPSCMLADAYATAFMAMGIKKTKEFIINQSSLDVYCVYLDKEGNWKTFITDNLSKKITY